MLFTLIDDFLLFSSMTVCLIAMLLMLRDAKSRIGPYLGVGTCIGTVALLLSNYRGIAEISGYGSGVITILQYCGIWFAWVFCLSMFEDKFTLTRRRWAVLGVILGIWSLQNLMYYNQFGDFKLVYQTQRFIPFLEEVAYARIVANSFSFIKSGMAIHMLFVAWFGRSGDLVEKRRQMRLVFVTGVAAIFIFQLSIGQAFTAVSSISEPVQLMLHSLAILCVAFYLLWHLSHGDADWLFGPPRRSEDSDQGNNRVEISRKDSPVDAANDADLALLKRLTCDAVLLEQDLTISRLADIAQIPEYRLRRLINQHLGFRNFAEYLNQYRIGVATVRLADQTERQTQVLVIAMDLGYGSLGPFNRAFKARTGQTPTEFRRQAQIAAE